MPLRGRKLANCIRTVSVEGYLLISNPSTITRTECVEDIERLRFVVGIAESLHAESKVGEFIGDNRTDLVLGQYVRSDLCSVSFLMLIPVCCASMSNSISPLMPIQ